MPESGFHNKYEYYTIVELDVMYTYEAYAGYTKPIKLQRREAPYPNIRQRATIDTTPAEQAETHDHCHYSNEQGHLKSTNDFVWGVSVDTYNRIKREQTKTA